jgi:hypothetical protein
MLETIINEGDFSALIGKIENDFFDCKKGIYALKDGSNKRELAKDVSSFANLNGGYILVGPETEETDSHFGDEIKKVNLFNQSLVNVTQYLNVINNWIYPEIEGVLVDWKPSKGDTSKGIIVIKIPPQKEFLKPFLIKKIVDERKQSEILFGYVERKRDKSEPKKVEYIHNTLRDGLLYDKNIAERFDNLEALLLPNQKQTAGNNKILEAKQRRVEDETKKIIDVEHIIRSRIDEILKVNEMYKRRSIILIAYTKDTSIGLKSIFTDRNSSIKRKLENPPTTRRDGWTLETKDRGKIVEGKLVRVAESRKTVDLYRDGTLIVTGRVDDGLLCHWVSSNKVKINPLAMIELIYNFILFYKEVIDDFTEQPGKIHFKFGFINMWLNEVKNYLIPGGYNTIAQQENLDPYPAQRSDYFSEPIGFNVAEFDVGKTAYKVIEEIYLWFGISPDEGNIPYTKTEDSSISIDIDQIKVIH